MKLITRNLIALFASCLRLTGLSIKYLPYAVFYGGIVYAGILYHAHLQIEAKEARLTALVEEYSKIYSQIQNYHNPKLPPNAWKA